MDKEKDINVEDITTTTFSIQGVPIKVFRRFLKFCESNALMTKVFIDRKGQKQIRQERCYSIALAQLLDVYEADAKSQMLFDKIQKIEDRMNKIEVKK